MDVVLEHICNSAILFNSHAVLNSEAWMAERADLKAIVGIVAIDSCLGKPGHLLVADTTVDDEHPISHVHLPPYNQMTI